MAWYARLWRAPAWALLRSAYQKLCAILRAVVAENEYHFIDRWRVEGEVKKVADILGDTLALPRWTFEQDGCFVNVTYDWTIRANKPIIEKLSFVLKPIFRSNDNWTMKRGEESLQLELLRRCVKSEEESACIPAGPRPSLVARILGLSK